MRVDEVLNGSHQRYIAADFLSARFFNKRIPLVIADVKKEDVSAVKENLLDSYGDVPVTFVRGGVQSVLCVSNLTATDGYNLMILDGSPVTE
ncbi:MAG: hypothetical protein K2N18_05425, partial [Clostridia bacterium]|nr:hypothetical protein [Clostridia bacterium]